MEMVVNYEHNSSHFTGNLIDLVISEVDTYAEVHITLAESEILLEKYYADATGTVWIRDLAQIFMPYFNLPDLSVLADEYHLPPLLVGFRILDASGNVSTFSINVFYSRGKISFTAGSTNLIYSRYRTIYTSIDREEYLTFYKSFSSKVEIIVTHLNNKMVRQTSKTVKLTDYSQTVACRLSLHRVSVLFGIEADNILYYDVKVNSDTGSDRIRYEVDNKNYRNTNNFLYHNFFGLPESITLTGIVEYNPELEGELISIDDCDIRLESQLTDLQVVNSGYLSKAKYAALTDLLTSPGLLHYNKGIKESVIITDIDFQHKRVGNEMINVAITYRPAQRNSATFDRIVRSTSKIFDRTFDYTFE